jgi:hypothetical protein
LKVEFAIAGIILAVMIGWLLGVLLEHPPGPGGLQVIGALLGGAIAITVLLLGEALKEKH